MRPLATVSAGGAEAATRSRSGVATGLEVREASLIRRCRLGHGSIRTDRINIVRTSRVMNAVCEYEGEGENAEANDNRREDERLWYRVREWRGCDAFRSDERRCSASDTRCGKDQHVRSVRQQAQADDELRQTSPQHEIEARGVEHSGNNRQQEFHVNPQSEQLRRA